MCDRGLTKYETFDHFNVRTFQKDNILIMRYGKKKKKFLIELNIKSSNLFLADLVPCHTGTSCPAACSWGWWVSPGPPWPHPHYRWESLPCPSPWRSSSSASAWPSPWDGLHGCCCWMRTTSCHWSRWCFCWWQLVLHCLRLQMQRSHSGHPPLSWGKNGTEFSGQTMCKKVLLAKHITSLICKMHNVL